MVKKIKLGFVGHGLRGYLIKHCAKMADVEPDLVIGDFDSSNADNFDSYFLGIVTIFYTILSLRKSLPIILTLFAMLNNLSA